MTSLGTRPIFNPSFGGSFWMHKKIIFAFYIICNIISLYIVYQVEYSPMGGKDLFMLHDTTSTVYWCIASKLKAPRNLYRMSNMFLWVEKCIFFVCYHVVPKRHSQLDYELNGLQNRRKLKTTRWRWWFFLIFTVTMSLESFDQLA